MALITASFMSKSLMRTVPVNIIMPTDKLTFPGQPEPSNEPKKLLVLLHGIFGNYTDWVTGTRVQAFAEAHDLAVVMPSGDNKFYCDSSTTGDRYGTFIGVELVDFMRKTFNVSKKREDTYIAGLSMGGYGTFLHGFSHPERFAAMCPLSAAVSMGSRDGEEFDPTTDPESLAEGIAKSGRKFPKLYIACGKQDFLYDANVKFRDKLISLGADVTWDETEEHGHEWRFWDLELEKALKWLPRTDAYAGSARKV